ncbi:transposase [Amycolatopsis sp. H6(2020)]|nr:transposase [Amycolatopsis sp. H6(2020)]
MDKAKATRAWPAKAARPGRAWSSLPAFFKYTLSAPTELPVGAPGSSGGDHGADTKVGRGRRPLRLAPLVGRVGAKGRWSIVEGERAVTSLGVLHGRLRSCFVRRRPFEQAGKYMTGLMSDLPRKNGWTIAEHVGDRTQRLLNHAVWDHDQAQGVVRRFVVEQLGDRPLRVGALDESGQEKQGT